MAALTSLGIIHTAISVVALVCGTWALARDRRITLNTKLGRAYVWATLLTCLTAFGIFQHGGFGKPHVLAVLTVAALAVAALGTYTSLFGGWTRYAPTLALTTTVFFHLIPGLTETFTRLPADAPLFSSAEDPALAKLVGALFVVYCVGIYLQVRELRGERLHAIAGRVTG